MKMHLQIYNILKLKKHILHDIIQRVLHNTCCIMTIETYWIYGLKKGIISNKIQKT